MNYIYDGANRLIRIEDDLTETVIAEYHYDPFDRRLWKEVNGVRTYFFYADEGLVGEFDADGNALVIYGWRPHSAWGTNPLFQQRDGNYYWYRNDRLGTPQALTEANGRVVWAADYDSYGKCRVSVDEVENNLRLPGQYHDAESGLYYNFRRYYDPDTGRYTQVDPAGAGLNPYAYAAGNPVSLIDPLGLCPWKQFLYSGWAGELADRLDDAAFLAKEWWLHTLVDAHPDSVLAI